MLACLVYRSVYQEPVLWLWCQCLSELCSCCHGWGSSRGVCGKRTRMQALTEMRGRFIVNNRTQSGDGKNRTKDNLNWEKQNYTMANLNTEGKENRGDMEEVISQNQKIPKLEPQVYTSYCTSYSSMNMLFCPSVNIFLGFPDFAARLKAVTQLKHGYLLELLFSYINTIYQYCTLSVNANILEKPTCHLVGFTQPMKTFIFYTVLIAFVSRH